MSNEPGSARACLYRVAVDADALLAVTLRRRLQAGRESRRKTEALSKWHNVRAQSARASSISANAPTTLCRHPIVETRAEQVLIRRAYRIVSRSEAWEVQKPSDWGRRWSLDRRALRQSGTVYHKTANDWFFLHREAAERAARRYRPGEPDASAESTRNEHESGGPAARRETDPPGAAR